MYRNKPKSAEEIQSYLLEEKARLENRLVKLCLDGYLRTDKVKHEVTLCVGALDKINDTISYVIDSQK